MTHQWIPDYATNAIERVLYGQEVIQGKVSELADKINRDYVGKELVVVGILKGAFMFMSDLTRRLTVPHACEFMALSSYGDSTTTSGSVRILMDLRKDIAGKHVLVVEDIVDSGLTLKYLLNLLQNRNPASLATAVLLRKSECLKVDLPVQYVGFEAPNEWVVGFGLDYAEKFRTLPFVGVLKKEVYHKE